MKQTPSILLLLSLAILTPVEAATNLWSAHINFNEFEGSSGGWDNDATPNILERGNGVAATVRNYDVLSQSSPGVYQKGQDGVADITMRAVVMEGNGDRWSRNVAMKRRDSYQGDITVDSGRSKSGDHTIIAYEFSTNSLNLTAAELGVCLSSANGLGEVYEWTMVTVGGIEDNSHFTVDQLHDYNALTYSNLSSSSYYDTNGKVKTNGVATNAELAKGKTMGEFLSGQNATGKQWQVANGWYALDARNTSIKDGPEANFTNPGSGTTSEDVLTVTGDMLGIGNDSVNKFTVWMGWYDVAFDSSGDGFTLTNSNQDISINHLLLGSRIGDPVPEPSTGLLGLIAGMFLSLRRKRK